jgi:pimeloyl-ACP methyl ester carboxylesterase
MLEMLNPGPGDVLRFAAQALKLRKEAKQVARLGDQALGELLAERFSTPPAAARRKPDVARLREDALRFFGWSKADWARFDERAQTLLKQVQTEDFVFEGHKVQVYHWPARGPSKGRVLLSHGWEGYALNFMLLIEMALEAGYEVWSFDHLAHGHSGGTLSGAPMMLRTLLAVSDHLVKRDGPWHALVGHSLGSAVACWAVAHQRIRVDRLVLMAQFYDTRKLTALWTKAHLLGEAERSVMQAEMERSAAMRFADFMPEALAPLLDAQPKLRTMLIHDEADKMTAFKHSQLMAQRIQRSQLIAAHKLGHVGILADEAIMRPLVAFWA